MNNFSDLNDSISNIISETNNSAKVVLDIKRKNNKLENEANRSTIKISEQNELQIKLLNKLIEQQNKSMLDNQKSSENSEKIVKEYVDYQKKSNKNNGVINIIILVVTIFTLVSSIVLHFI